MASDKKTQQVPQEGLPTLVSPKLRLEVPAHLLKMETAEASATPHFDAREDANDAAALPSAPARVQVTQGVPGQVSERSRRQDGHLNGHQNRAPNDSNIQQEAALGSRSMLKLDQQSLWSLGDSRSQSPPKKGSYQRTVHARNNSSGRTIAPQTLPPLAPQNLPTQPEWQGHSYQHTVHARNNGSLDSSFNVLT